MEVAKVFSNGGSQAVRLPKTCRFDEDEILVNVQRCISQLSLFSEQNPDRVCHPVLRRSNVPRQTLRIRLLIFS